ncbi:glycosyltransferase family 4 protein [Falsiroseomonas sp. HW251]|uniref:glycosyltransferase family 4 protein n=1 Tax=Falsiroseomonas sp. HW251 TaxID=3390998 RepID=UPI003D31C276
MPANRAPHGAAILYAPDGYDTSRPRLMGRHAAGEGFLAGLVRHSGFDRLVALTRSQRDADAFRQHVARLAAAQGVTLPTEAIPDSDYARLREIGCFFLPGPGLGDFAWRRRRVGEAAAFSLVGITHTIASAGAMDSIVESLVAPVQEWDAIVCTSTAVQKAVRRLLEGQARYLQQRLGATRIEGPQLPVIPLGVDAAALAPDPRARAEWRERLAIGDRDIVVLHHGRLSFHAKGHPLAMFAAIGRAASRAPAGSKVVLVLSGWYADDVQRRAFEQQAAAVAPDLAIRLVERPPADTTIRNVADLFTLLSDNVQESFGLAPVEALAAGLPVVGTDWDGLKDTVKHGETGFRVPVTMAGPMTDLADRHDTGLDTYDQFIAGIAQFTAVDVPAAEQAFAALFADAGLRARMGQAARRDAASRFDWAAVIPRWIGLVEELATIRAAARAERAQPLRGQERLPHRPDPSVLFADYPTRRLSPETRLRLVQGEDAAAAMRRMQHLAGLTGTVPRRDLLPGGDALQETLERLQDGPATVAQLTAEMPGPRAWRAQRALAWLLKMDLVQLAGD